jgi:hypothetical protein
MGRADRPGWGWLADEAEGESVASWRIGPSVGLQVA